MVVLRPVYIIPAMRSALSSMDMSFSTSCYYSWPESRLLDKYDQLRRIPLCVRGSGMFILVKLLSYSRLIISRNSPETL